MFSLGGLTFVAPWLLGALSVVPVLWWILRVMPPRPKTVKFPAFFLLKDLETDIKTAAHTPWWLLLLRSLVVIFFILALADPVMKLSTALPGTGGSVLVAVDNGWSAANNWPQRMAKLKEYLAQIKRSGRTVIFLPTAPDENDGFVHGYGPLEAGEAEEWASHMKPVPWPIDQKAALNTVAEEIKTHDITRSVYISDGTAQTRDAGMSLLAALDHAGGLTLVTDEKTNDPFILRKADVKPGTLSFKLERLTAASTARPMVLAAYAEEGNILDTLKFTYPADATTMDLKWDVLREMRDKMARIAVQVPQTAATTYLTDSQWRQHPVGIIADETRKDSQSFLNEVYYLRRALETSGGMDVDGVDDLLQKNLSALIWPDSAALTAVERVDLYNWVNEGGFLIRFAGPNLAATPEDPLLPVPLRFGQRALEGAMTWEKPLKLGAIGENSPLNGLDVPADVIVNRQVLADPTPQTFEKTWLQLEDGTPLITGGAIGKGEVVLVHTTAGPDWSNFSYSGLFVSALQRMISLSTGISDYKAETMMAPYMVLDGYGRLQSPGNKAIIAPFDPKKGFTPSPVTPPGLYGSDRQFQVFNLGDALPKMIPLTGAAASVDTADYTLSGEKSMKADFLKWALWLLLLDTAVTLWLRGVFVLPGKAAAAVLFAMLLLHAGAARAQTAYDSVATDLVSNIYLAYIQTGDTDVDEVSYNGLTDLMRVVNSRTTIKIKGVRAVNPGMEQLYYYPFIYWPMSAYQADLPVTAARNIQSYLAQGGMILFDTRDQQFAGPSGDVNGATIGTKKLRELTDKISIPELMPVEQGNILTKSFYLLDDFPGLYDGSKVWVEKEPSPSHDGVTSVIIGGNDWAGAWSQADRGRFTISGGEQQREMAYRFGVNMLMVALTGNYKSDQIHVPYILERLRK
ncbi:MAG: DUF4159 domain-containing protein [Micavibrio sp.]|nr:DUF4159 domain-containing protein [Micavibrio sp.]